jgi:outer membrane lipoprotein-sorting protein
MKRLNLLLLSYFVCILAYAQTAKEVLDKTASAISAKSGVQAAFTIKGASFNTSGNFSMKGRKFHATTPQATIWFDGTTQWTYMKKNDEVNISKPTEAQQQAINPYTFIHLYKDGYSYTLAKKGQSYELHLTATKKKSIQEMYITVSQKTYIPSQVRYNQGKGWTTIDITGFKQTALSDEIFRFNSKNFPQAEIIDLR